MPCFLYPIPRPPTIFAGNGAASEGHLDQSIVESSLTELGHKFLRVVVEEGKCTGAVAIPQTPHEIPQQAA